MDDYQYECPSPDIDMLAHVISDLFPEQTQFAERIDENGRTSLVIHYIAMRFGSTARRITIDVRFDPAALTRYRALPPRLHARSYAVLRAYVEATLGSLEERYANGETVPRETEIEMGEDFA
ncbi:DUF3022 domain-containing protein [Caballeronia sp. LZ062]|uniref:DUF3022 domain-containing protein n=1 Tax=unclassified Caballeronia TaxID=2646786 RepID=UPI00285E71E7|nr:MULTISPECIES: DUF3022 domain-containing protein [unclassified Caballeronia]MDR5854605.1 DUF3022 domain-containing protein [Caballeronia sp. LZ050]MDR5870867.1 DUF3022 domain-containing protein [Caballeronia sp. LZ062]